MLDVDSGCVHFALEEGLQFGAAPARAPRNAQSQALASTSPALRGTPLPFAMSPHLPSPVLSAPSIHAPFPLPLHSFWRSTLMLHHSSPSTDPPTNGTNNDPFPSTHTHMGK
ncbi:hypothetical protein B0H12DRAFT_1241372 [Mycena haematopus]|nr:hypothetical protein B0H12DRAFT_1241372 [Mycena haematopus]